MKEPMKKQIKEPMKNRKKNIISHWLTMNQSDHI